MSFLNINMIIVTILVLRFLVKLRFPANTPISTILQRRYGSDGLQAFRTYEKLDKRYRKTKLDLDFLQSCDFYGVVPKFLHFKLAIPRLRSSAMYDTCRRRLLSTELAQKRRHLKRSEEKIKTSQEHLRSIFSWFDYNHLISFVATFNSKSLKRVEIVQNRKLENLKLEYLAAGIDPDTVIFNYSTYNLNDIEKKVLSRGLKFSIRPDKLDYCDFLTPFEKLAISLKNRPIVKEGVNFDYVKTRLKSIAYRAGCLLWI